MWLCKVLPMLPFPGVMVTTLVLVVALKLVSFYQHNTEVLEMVQKIRKINTNENYRDLFGMQEIDNKNLEILVKNKDTVEKLLDWGHYCYFMVAPTLCYQLSYPRNASIRPVWLFKRFIEYILVAALELVLWVQYYMPALDEFVVMIETGTYTTTSIIYKILQMSIPTILMWLGMFYMLFQVHLNILAELLRFADRRFYEDWWNCKTLSEYWRLWNLPVHYWCVRHVYNPLLKKGVNRTVANFSVFLVSAICHEYLVSVPLGLASYWAFIAMLLQSPMC
jgi:diacylglycerol O-acyltransferase-1